MLSIGMGTRGTSGGSNGLGFAAAGDTSADVEGQTIQVRMARMHRDRDTGDLTYLISDETVIVPAGYYEASDPALTFTVGGVTYAMSSTAETDENGDGLRHFLVDYGGFEHGMRHRVSVVRTGYPDVLYERGFFIVGLETDPAGLPGGTARYDGRFNSTVTLSENGGTPGHDYRVVNGSLGFDVAFDEGTISGDFSALAVTRRNDEAPNYEENIFGTIPQVNLTGNGFESTMVIDRCPAYDACASDSIIGGAFYGDDAGRLSGLMMIDMTLVRSSDGATLRLQGPGAFYSEVTE